MTVSLSMAWGAVDQKVASCIPEQNVSVFIQTLSKCYESFKYDLISDTNRTVSCCECHPAK